jgi:pyruvate kinase
MGRKAKIAITLGPAAGSQRVLNSLVAAGVDVARLNLSHGDLTQHRTRVARLRRAARTAGRTVALLADLQGPRFRVGRLGGEALELEDGADVRLIAGKRSSPEGTIPVPYSALADDVRRGQRILIDDGNIVLHVERVRKNVLHCVVESGGTVTDNKGINLPGCRLSVPTITAKDRRDLRGAVELGADWLAISFVRSPDDMRQARRLVKRAGGQTLVLAKLERPEAIERLDEIIEASDGLMVARGDLGVELSAEEVPILQKRIIERCNVAGKPVVTATQMLDSMRHSPRPTRAEASDVANAVLDGSDCLLLTAETAVGRYPVRAVSTMRRIIEKAETVARRELRAPAAGELTVPLTTCHAACGAAGDVGARYLAVFTQSGFSALQTARFRPQTPILAFTPELAVQRRLNLLWGVQPRRLPARRSFEALLKSLDRTLLGEGLAKQGEIVVVLMGSPIGVSGTTNIIDVYPVGSASEA